MSPEKTREDNVTVIEEPKKDKTEVKALPPPENYTPPPLEPQAQQVTQDLDGVSADLAPALFCGPSDGEWEAFPSNEKESNLWKERAVLGGIHCY